MGGNKKGCYLRRLVVTVLAFGMLGATSGALAQSNFGTIALARGFQPDPHIANGTSGGQRQATALNASCQGWIANTPDHILNLTTPFTWLRVFAESASDTTLVIQAANGQVFCNDDTFDRNPAVQQAFGPGSYRVWVGSYQQGQNAPYQLKITELQSVVPGGAAAANTTSPGGTRACGRSVRGSAVCVDANAARVNFGCRNGQACALTTGFTPDPMTFRIRAGGGSDPIDVSTLNLHDAADNSVCGRSFITARPDFRFTFAAGTRFPLLRLYVQTQNGSDATLLVNTPDGRWRCNDDSYGGRMPTIDFQNAPAGRYDVWIGTYDASSSNPATFHVTELDSNHP